jgi:DNA-binding beta-propeller fold protein YncE
MPGTPVRADVVVNNINVGEGASDIVVNPVTNTVYVTTNDGLTIINGSTQATATAKVKTGGVPADRDGTR